MKSTKTASGDRPGLLVRAAELLGGLAGPAAGSPPGPAARRALVPALAWTALLLATLLVTGCPRATPLWFLFAGGTLAIVAGELLFLRAVFRRGATGLYLAWKKFTGYSLPAFYALHALPRVEWSNAGLIGPGRVALVFGLTLACTAAGAFAFFLAGRPRALADAGVIGPDEAGDAALRRKMGKARHKRGVLASILEWVDALAWAAIAVLVVNIFVFQLYVVPSESMVPTFLMSDRPFTLKLATGPRVPLTQWRLPFLRLPARGDVVTIANPRYPENSRVDLKKYFSQFVYMLTFTAVNLDSTLPDGSPKADPLVKRVVGVPGERLMMVDDILYADSGAGFRPVEEPWRRVDLWKEDAALRSRIASIPLEEEGRAILAAWDARKDAVDPVALAATIAARAAKIARLASLPGMAAFATRDLPRVDPKASTLAAELAGDRGGENPFSEAGPSGDDLAFAGALALSPARALDDALSAYAAGAVASAAKTPADLYARSSRALSLLVKDNLLALIERDLELAGSGKGIEVFGADAERRRLLASHRELRAYLLGYHDMRSFPAFPEGGPLGPDEYFAMGDNRYNSFDFRYSTETRLRSLDPGDPASVAYPSMVAPFPVKLRFIEGQALFRLWPPSRMGRIR